MFRSIETSMWSDPKVKALSPEGKLLFLYLITNNHAHVSGIYYLPIVMIAHETGLSTRVLDTLFTTLSDTRMAFRDEEFEVIWVVNMLRYQGSGGQIKKAVEHQLSTLHNCPLIPKFLSHYRDLSLKYVSPHNTLSDTLPDSPCDTRAPVYKDQDQDQDQEKDQEIPIVDSVESTTPDRMDMSGLVETWNRVCPPHGLPRKTKITQKLRDQIKRRLTHNPEPDFWIAVIETIPTRPFLLGQNDQGWTATLDWLVKNDENAVKVHEGHYQSNQGRAPPNSKAQRAEEMQDWARRQRERRESREASQ